MYFLPPIPPTPYMPPHLLAFGLTLYFLPPIPPTPYMPPHLLASG